MGNPGLGAGGRISRSYPEWNKRLKRRLAMEQHLKLNYYEKWRDQEGIPVIKDYSVPDLMAVPLKPWQRKGGLGAFINLVGADGINDAYLCEIPPGAELHPQKHLFEELIFILSGRGATTVWVEGGPKQTFEWQEGSLFSPPLNVWHQHFNGQGDKPARYLAVTLAPTFLNLFNDFEFVFNNNYVFKDRYPGEEDYFSKGTLHPRRIWESNFIADVYKFKLQEWKERGAGGVNIRFEMAHNLMCPHISEFPVGTYKKAHRHGPGAHIVILSGQGYSLIWPEGGERLKIDWKVGSLFAPPDRWFHQHFNTGRDPARYMALKAGGSPRYTGITKLYGIETSTKLGGDQMEYEDEDPEIRRIFKEELAKTGAEWRMSQFFPGE